VRSYNEWGLSPYSATQCATAGTYPPNHPSGLHVTREREYTDRLYVEWYDNSSIEEYFLVERRQYISVSLAPDEYTDWGFVRYVQSEDPHDKGWWVGMWDEGLDDNSLYCYRVRACDEHDWCSTLASPAGDEWDEDACGTTRGASSRPEPPRPADLAFSVRPYMVNQWNEKVDHIHEGEPFSVVWTFCNEGKSSTDYFVDIVTDDAGVEYILPQGPMAPGECRQDVLTDADGHSGGGLVAIVPWYDRLDAHLVVRESNEDNNERYYGVVVYPASP